MDAREHLFGWVLVMALGACGGQGRESGQLSEQPTLGGVYSAPSEFVSENPYQFGEVIGLVSHAGEAHLVFMGQSQLVGTIELDQDYRLSASLNAYAVNGHQFADNNVTGEIVLRGEFMTSRAGIYGVYSGTGDNGRFYLYLSPEYYTATPLNRLDGVWSHSTASSSGQLFTRTFAVDATGSIEGSDTSGCVYDGQFSEIDPCCNLIRVRLDLSLCIHAGSYDGFATLKRSTTSTEPNMIILGVSNASAAINGELWKN